MRDDREAFTQDLLSVGGGVKTTATHASLAEQSDGVFISLQLLGAGFGLLDEHSSPSV